MQTILGAGGAIGIELVKALFKKGQQVRLVGRNPKLVEGANEIVSASYLFAIEITPWIGDLCPPRRPWFELTNPHRYPTHFRYAEANGQYGA